jgi:hypothetical protein
MEILDSTKKYGHNINKCSVTGLSLNTWRWPPVAETCDIINKNNNKLHCDGIIYNILKHRRWHYAEPTEHPDI